MDELIKSLNTNSFVRVGIIGGKASQAHPNKEGKGNKTNAEIGTYHEFGSEKVKDHPPRRSFLADSLKFKIRFDEQQMKPLKNDLFKFVFEEKKPKMETLSNS